MATKDPLEPMVLIIPAVSDTYNTECRLCRDAVAHQVRAILQFRRWVEGYKARFQREHPKCTDCTILMGDGHVETKADVKYCSSCAQTRRKARQREGVAAP